MTTDLTLARRAVTCPGWRWMAGMRSLSDPKARVWRMRDHGGNVEPMLEAGPRLRELAPRLDVLFPDLTDPATLGCLLHLVREAWGDPRLAVLDQGDGEPCWTLVRHDEEWGTVDACPGSPVSGTSEAEAMVAALEAVP